MTDYYIQDMFIYKADLLCVKHIAFNTFEDIAFNFRTMEQLQNKNKCLLKLGSLSMSGNQWRYYL